MDKPKMYMFPILVKVPVEEISSVSKALERALDDYFKDRPVFKLVLRPNEVPVSTPIEKFRSLAFAAKQLCEWTRYNEYPKEMTEEFMHLTQLIDNLDTEVRRVFPHRSMES